MTTDRQQFVTPSSRGITLAVNETSMCRPSHGLRCFEMDLLNRNTSCEGISSTVCYGESESTSTEMRTDSGSCQLADSTGIVCRDSSENTASTGSLTHTPLTTNSLPSLQRSSLADIDAFITDTDVAPSDFSRHTQLKCSPLKLISQLDGTVPGSDSEDSDDNVDSSVGYDNVLLRSLYQTFAAADGVMSPFKCVKCRRVYRTEESCALHSAVCTFEVSSSSGSERSNHDERWSDGSDEETHSCCSDDDDGLMSDYLNSSRYSQSCQTDTPDNCDVNANVKMLRHSDVKTELHSRLDTTECDCETESGVYEESSRVMLDKTVMTCSTSCVDGVEQTVVDSGCHVDEAVRNDEQSAVMTSSHGIPTLSESLECKNSVNCEQLAVSVDSQVQPVVDCHLGVDCESVETSVTVDVPVPSVSVAVFNNVSFTTSHTTSPTVSSSESATTTTVCETVRQCGMTTVSSCLSSCFDNSQSNTCYSNDTRSLCTDVSSLNSAVRLRDMLISSATTVSPSTTVLTTTRNNCSSTSVTTSRQILDTAWLPVGLLSTASLVVPAALPYAVVRPHPLYAAVGRGPAQPSSLGQRVPLVQQFLRPAVVAPVLWFAPRLTPCQVVTPACSLLYTSSQQSASQRPVLSAWQVTGAQYQPVIVQQPTVGTDTGRVPAMRPQGSRVSVVTSLQSVIRSQQSVAATRPPWSSSLSPTCSVCVNPSSLMVHSPSTSSKYVSSSVVPVTVSSMCNERAGERCSRADVTDTEAGFDGPSLSMQETPMLNDLLPAHSVTTAARCSPRCVSTHVTCRPQSVSSSPALLSLAVCSVPRNSRCIVTNSLPVAGNAAMSPRFITQPSSSVVSSEPVSTTPLSTVPPINSFTPHLLVSSHTDKVSVFSGNISPCDGHLPTVVSDNNWSSESVDAQEIFCSPAFTTAEIGK